MILKAQISPDDHSIHEIGNGRMAPSKIYVIIFGNPRDKSCSGIALHLGPVFINLDFGWDSTWNVPPRPKSQQHVVVVILAAVVAVAGGAAVEAKEAVQMESLCFFRNNYFSFH